MSTKQRRKVLERITVDRKIVEGLRDGKSVSYLTNHFNKGKGYVIKIRDLALEYDYISIVSDAGAKIYKATARLLPAYPEILFPLRDGRGEKPIETDLLLQPQNLWIKDRLELGWSPQTIFEELSVGVPRSNFYRYLHRHKLFVFLARLDG